VKAIPTYALIAALGMGAGFSFYQLVLAPGLAINTAQAADSRSEMPTTLPDFSLQDREGKKTSIRSWPGKSMVINFWATWCAPCRKEIPFLKELNQTYGPKGVQIVGIAVDTREAVLKYADKAQINYPLLIGEEDALTAIEAFGVQAVAYPFTVFTDAKARIVFLHLGELKPAEAPIIFGAIERVNSGELTPTAARAAIAKQLTAAK
jgi:peroxiredoxin